MSLTEDEARRLSEALTLIASHLDPPERGPVTHIANPHRAPAPRSRMARPMAAIFVAACVVAAIVWSVTIRESTSDETSTASDQAAESAQSPGEYWVCAETVVEGSVTDVQSEGVDRLRVTVDVSSWIKPTSGPGTVRLDLPDPETQGLPKIRTGTAYLLSVPTNQSVAADTFRGEDIANGLRVIAEGRHQADTQGITECPKYWRELRP